MTASKSTASGTHAAEYGPDEDAGQGFVATGGPLIGLNYYDGRFLRADDLNLERTAQRRYADLGQLSGGPGVVYGFNLSDDGETLNLSRGLAVDPRGRLLYLPSEVKAKVVDLLKGAGAADNPAGKETTPSKFAACKSDEPPGGAEVVAGAALYRVVLRYLQRSYGQGEVFGRLCDDGCITPTDRPYLVDGVSLLLQPLRLHHDLPSLAGLTHPEIHLRSQVASAYFGDEWDASGSLLVGNGLVSSIWCAGAPPASGDDLVPLGVLSWNGASIDWLDQWTARRERMDGATRQYWAGRLEQRPWPVFLAQVLQFQCQLSDLAAVSTDAFIAAARKQRHARKGLAFRQSRAVYEELSQAVADLGQDQDPVRAKKLYDALHMLDELTDDAPSPQQTGSGDPAPVADPLTSLGIVECPPAGYLPVDLGSSAGVREQMQTLLGASVQLRVCAVRRDQIAHEFERAQHMDRISLLRGLLKASDREQVDILVPDGLLTTDDRDRTSYGFAVDVAVGQTEPAQRGSLAIAARKNPQQMLLQGAARLDLAEGITTRAVVAGSAASAVRSFARLMSGLGRAGNDEALDELGKLHFGTAETSLPMLREIGRAVVSQAIDQRAAGNVKVVAMHDLPSQVVAASVSVWTGRDPFEMADHTSAEFAFGFDLFLPAAQPVSIRFQATGRLQRQSERTGAVGPEVLVTVSGLADSVTTGTSRSGPSGSFNLPLVLRRGEGEGKDLFGISNDPMTLLLGLAWENHPIEATGALVRLATTSLVNRGLAGVADVFSMVIGGGGPFPPLPGAQAVATLGALEDPQINTPGEQHRDSALAALQILSGLYPKDPSYVERGYAELFPSDSSSVEARVRPTTNWVLFRRRRRTDCEATVEAPSTRLGKVAAWVTRADDLEHAAALAQDLFGSSQGTSPWSPTPVDFVDFDAGTATLRSASSAWRQRYQAAGGGPVVFAAAYGSSPGAPDAPVGVGRAKALVDATSPLATMEPGGLVDVLKSPPAGQMLVGTDGSIFLITYNDDPVDVFTIDGALQENQPIVEALATADVDAVAAADSTQVALLTSLAFPPGVTGQRATELQAMLDKRRKEISEAHDGLELQADLTVWTAKGLAGVRLERSGEHVDAVVEGLAVSAASDNRVTADFPIGKEAPVRIYVVFSFIPFE
jgi:hypothetical protein